LVFIAKRWVKGFGKEDKYVRKDIYIYTYIYTYIYIYVCVCAHIRKKERKREKKRKRKKRERNPRQCNKDIMRDDKSSEDQEKCEEGCDDVENESLIFHMMCNPTSRTSLVH
jgi:hypothetical protein